MEKIATYSKSLQEHAGIAAVGKMLAAMIHYENVVYQETLQHTSVLDSGAARHVHPDVIITDISDWMYVPRSPRILHRCAFIGDLVHPIFVVYHSNHQFSYCCHACVLLQRVGEVCDLLHISLKQVGERLPLFHISCGG